MPSSFPPGPANLLRSDARWRRRAYLGGIIGAVQVVTGGGNISAQEVDLQSQPVAPTTASDARETPADDQGQPDAAPHQLAASDRASASTRAFWFGSEGSSAGESRVGMSPSLGPFGLLGLRRLGIGDDKQAVPHPPAQANDARRVQSETMPAGERTSDPGVTTLAGLNEPEGVQPVIEASDASTLQALSVDVTVASDAVIAGQGALIDRLERPPESAPGPIGSPAAEEITPALSVVAEAPASPAGAEAAKADAPREAVALAASEVELGDNRMAGDLASDGPLAASFDPVAVAQAQSIDAVSIARSFALEGLGELGAQEEEEAAGSAVGAAPTDPSVMTLAEAASAEPLALQVSAGLARKVDARDASQSETPNMALEPSASPALDQNTAALTLVAEAPSSEAPTGLAREVDARDASQSETPNMALEPSGSPSPDQNTPALTLVAEAPSSEAPTGLARKVEAEDASQSETPNMAPGPIGSPAAEEITPALSVVAEASASPAGAEAAKADAPREAVALAASEVELGDNPMAAVLASDGPLAASLDPVAVAQAQSIDAVSIARSFALEALGELGAQEEEEAAETAVGAAPTDPSVVTLAEAASADPLAPQVSAGLAHKVDAGDGAESETLGEAILAAIADNPDILSAMARRDDAKYAMRQSRAALLPSVDLTVSSGLEGTRAEEDPFEEANRAEAQVALRQLIWDFGAVGNDVKRARLIYEGVDWALRREVERVAFDVAAAYIGVLERQQLAALAEENLAAHERILETVRNQREFGLVSGADVSRVEAKINAARGALLDRRSDLAVAKEGFRRQLNRLPGQLAPAPLGEPLIPTDVEATLELAETGNPELRQAAALLESIRRQVAGQRAGRLPRIEVEAQGNWKDNVGGPVGRSDDARAMLTMRYKIFDGGAQDAAIARTGARLRQAQFDFDRTRRDIVQLVRNDYAALAAARDKVGAIDQEVQAGERLVDLYIAQFRAGGRSVFDVLDSQETLITAKAKRIANVAAREVAAYRVLQNIGALFLTATGERFEPPREKPSKS